ncbi:tyrosine-type recombinase/integrase [Peribacillus frigoritolerans]|nr:tyrosine-type recombinase/integrase [Peribacillus frigoritolerans]
MPIKKNIEAYEFNPKVNVDTKAPKYIKPNDYKRIVELIENEYTIRDHILVKLMYEYSLRIGEALGLTLEDIVQTDEDGIYRLVLRNRVSDKPWQHVKSVMTPTDVSHYSSAEYKENNIGYQIVYINEEMKDLIDEYIEEVWDERVLSKSKKKKSKLIRQV